MIFRKIYSSGLPSQALWQAVLLEAQNLSVDKPKIASDRISLTIPGPPIGNKTNLRYTVSCHVCGKENAAQLRVSVYPGLVAALTGLVALSSLIQSVCFHISGRDDLPAVLILLAINLLFHAFVCWQEACCAKTIIDKCAQRAHTSKGG